MFFAPLYCSRWEHNSCWSYILYPAMWSIEQLLKTSNAAWGKKITKSSVDVRFTWFREKKWWWLTFLLSVIHPVLQTVRSQETSPMTRLKRKRDNVFSCLKPNGADTRCPPFISIVQWSNQYACLFMQPLTPLPTILVNRCFVWFFFFFFRINLIKDHGCINETYENWSALIFIIRADQNIFII